MHTSVLSFPFLTRDAERKELILKLLKKIKRRIFLGYISNIVFEEARQMRRKKRDEFEKFIKDLNLDSLAITAKVKALADKYVEEKAIPFEKYNDAVQIALGSVYNLDAIIFGNFDDMVKVKTRLEVRRVNKIMGYENMDICCPEHIVPPKEPKTMRELHAIRRRIYEQTKQRKS